MVDAQELKIHPFGELLPPMANEQFTHLVGSIVTNGQQEPIVLFEGQIVDGRARYLACLAAKVEPKVTIAAFNAPEEMLDHILKHKVAGCNLTAGQKAIIGARVLTLPREYRPLWSVKELAERIQVGADAIGDARLILRYGSSEEIKEIDNGAGSLNKIGLAVRGRITSEQRKAVWGHRGRVRRGGGPQHQTLQQQRSEVWTIIRQGLDAFTSLPQVSDTIGACTASGPQRRFVNERLERAVRWLNEFASAWRETDAGNGKSANQG